MDKEYGKLKLSATKTVAEVFRPPVIEMMIGKSVES